MQETTYDDGRKVIRFGPLSEIQKTMMADLTKEGVASVFAMKVTPEVVDDAIAEMRRKMGLAPRDGRRV